jgi:hypothetical protein
MEKLVHRLVPERGAVVDTEPVLGEEARA